VRIVSELVERHGRVPTYPEGPTGTGPSGVSEVSGGRVCGW
jgi:hypothetical protein